MLRLGYRRTWIIAALTFLPGLFLFLMMIANDFYSGLIGTLLVAPGLAASMIMPFPVISEVIDDDAKKEHGYRREGIFFGKNGGITKLAFSAQGILFAAVMTTAGYAAGETVQSASAISGIRFTISGTTIIASLIVAFCMWRYPLGRKNQALAVSAEAS